jgi:hypothetical protein
MNVGDIYTEKTEHRVKMLGEHQGFAVVRRLCPLGKIPVQPVDKRSGKTAHGTKVVTEKEEPFIVEAGRLTAQIAEKVDKISGTRRPKAPKAPKDKADTGK